MQAAMLADAFAEDAKLAASTDELKLSVDVSPGTFRRDGDSAGWDVVAGKTVQVEIKVTKRSGGGRYPDDRIQLTANSKDYQGRGPHKVALPARSTDLTLKVRVVLADGKTHTLGRRMLWVAPATRARSGGGTSTTTTTSSPPTSTTLQKQKQALDAVIKASGSSFSELAAAYAKLELVEHRLAIETNGSGLYQGTKCSPKDPDAVDTDCTQIVLKVLARAFKQGGNEATWKQVRTQATANMKARGDTKLSGLDYQAALQAIDGWKGIYWAPDPAYQVPAAELTGANSSEASVTNGIAKKRSTYFKDYHLDGVTTGYPGVTIAQRVIDYAPEAPTSGYGDASTTTADRSTLKKLKKLTFGVLSAHGGFHMTLITEGKVIEVHWDKVSTDPNVIEQTDLETWAIGPKSGYHYYASGVIVSPKADFDAAFP